MVPITRVANVQPGEWKNFVDTIGCPFFTQAYRYLRPENTTDFNRRSPGPLLSREWGPPYGLLPYLWILSPLVGLILRFHSTPQPRVRVLPSAGFCPLYVVLFPC